MTTEPSKTPNNFHYLLNALEDAGNHTDPAVQMYGPKRKAVLDYVSNLETKLSAALSANAALKTEKERLVEELQRIADFTTGYDDMCLVINRRARKALAVHDKEKT